MHRSVGRARQRDVAGLEHCRDWGVDRPPAADALTELLPKLPYVNAVLSRYNLLLMRAIVISVACSQFHAPEQRIPRWLLDHNHRAGLKEFPFTTEFLSAQVGIDTDTTRRVLDDLQQRRLIAKGARDVSIVDAEALARESCARFQLTKDATDGYLRGADPVVTRLLALTSGSICRWCVSKSPPTRSHAFPFRPGS